MNDGGQKQDLAAQVPAFTPRWLHWYALFVAASVLVLIGSGGLVTSKGAGLAVPDWPTTYGYNVFAFPISRWVGGVLYEHAHRLIASGVGFLTLALAIGLWFAERRLWVRNLGIAAVVAVVVQAVLGGLRVIELKDEIGIFHAGLAQAFLLLVAFIALVTSPWWQRPAVAPPVPWATAGLGSLRRVFAVLAGLIYVQLALGATMRHAHAGLSIPDFPTAYGQAWPRIDAARLAQINLERDETLHLPPTTLMQIHLQMGHRVLAFVIALTTGYAAWLGWRQRALLPAALCRLSLFGPVLIAAQIALGIATIWTNKAADVATAHVLLGALLLVWAGLTYASLRRWLPAIVARRPDLDISRILDPDAHPMEVVP